MPWKRSTYIAFTPVVGNAQTHLKLKGPELKARKKQKGKGRKLICSNTHGSLTEKLHSVTKQVNINETYCILLCFVNIKTFYDKNVYYNKFSFAFYNDHNASFWFKF